MKIKRAKLILVKELGTTLNVVDIWFVISKISVLG